MPEEKSEGQAFTVRRVDRETLLFDYRTHGKRVRRMAKIEALTAFLEGNVDADSNLPHDAVPTPFTEFAEGTYIPFDAKPRLEKNASSLESEQYLVKALCKRLGNKPLHELRQPDATDIRNYWLERDEVNNTVKKRLNCLRRIMDFAVEKGLIKLNPLLRVRGLPVGNRSAIWLHTSGIDLLLKHCPMVIRLLVEYQALTSARIGEARDFREGDIRDGKLGVPTEKRRCPPREAMRYFEIASLGPRFARLMAQLKPHPKTGFYFYADEKTGEPISKSYANRLFRAACEAAGFPDLHDHDLRGTFLQHRRPFVPTQDQLVYEMGHSDARCLRSYRDSRNRLEPHESIFYVAPKPGPMTAPGIVLPTDVAIPSPIVVNEQPSDTLLH